MLRTDRTRERGSVLALALLVVVLLSLIGLAIVQLAADDNVRERIQYRRAQGEWRVRGACQWAVWQMASSDPGAANDYDWGLDSAKSLDFPIEGSDLPSTVALTIEEYEDHPEDQGNQNGSDPVDTMKREIRGETEIVGRTVIARDVVDLVPYPPVGSYAILSSGVVEVSGSAVITSPLDLNANVHTNGLKLEVGGSADIYGFCTSVNEFQTTGEAYTIDPPNNPWGWPVSSENVNPVPIPSMDPASLRPTLMDGEWTVPGYDGARYFEPDDPALGDDKKQTHNQLNWATYRSDGSMGTTLVFIDGSWQPNGSYTITGRVTLVISEDYDPTFGNLGIRAADGESELLIVASSIRLAGNADLKASFYATDTLSVDINGNAKVEGQFISQGDVDLSGNFALDYVPLSDELWPGTIGPEELCYQTRIGDQDW